MTDDSESAGGPASIDGSPPSDDPRPTDGPRSTDDPRPTDGARAAGTLPATDGADHWVYVLRCADGTLYTGYTTDVGRRVAEHDAGDGAKYTRGRTPVELVHVEGFESRSAALAREYEVKTLSRRQKERLVG